MSDFPRGWTLSTNAGNPSTASITVPAVAGVVHVLDAFTAYLSCFAAAGGGTAPNILLSSSDGVFSSFILGNVGSNGGAVVTDTASGSGLDLAAGPGASLTIAFSAAAPVNYNQLLLIQGHDI